MGRVNISAHVQLTQDQGNLDASGLVTARVPSLFGIGDCFHARQLFHGLGLGGMVSGWFKHIKLMVHCISMSITSAPPQIIRLDPGAWGLLLWQDCRAVLQQVFSTLAAHWTHLRNFKILTLRSHPPPDPQDPNLIGLGVAWEPGVSKVPKVIEMHDSSWEAR